MNPHRQADNWVDCGEPPEPTLRRILAFYFGRHAADDAPWLAEHAAAAEPRPYADDR